MSFQLVADIGGTNARFAVIETGTFELKNIQTLQCESFGSPLQAINHYLASNDIKVTDACLAVACPVSGDTVKLTNNHWQFSRERLAHSLGLQSLVAINDFTAAAMATTVVTDNDLFYLSDELHFDLNQQRCILGPGTGLGVAGMLSYQGKTLVLSTEGGHRSFSPETEIEDYILQFLRAELSIVSCEELLSGRGILNIYRAVCSYQQENVLYSDVKSIAGAALENNQVALKTLNTFFEILGSVAGDFALSMGAIGGVYIGGGIAPRYAELLKQSRFRERFENKLNYQKYLRKIPTAIVTHEQAGLLGAAAYLTYVK